MSTPTLRIVLQMNKEILDVTCSFRGMWFDKNHPLAVYADKRRERFEYKDVNTDGRNRICNVDPDVLCDFTDLPFEDESFYLVVMDPPHLKSLSPNSIMAQKYGVLIAGWEEVIRAGVDECMRVLKPGGTFIFKWNEGSVSVRKVLDVIRHKPTFGHTTAKSGKTKWITFYKPTRSPSLLSIRKRNSTSSSTSNL